MLRIELFPVGYGDAILISYGPGETAEHHILIDAGQATKVRPVRTRLKEIRADGGRIDLFVITHIDCDHIGGAIKLLGAKSTAGMIDEIWFNGYKHLKRSAGLLGPIQGEKLTKLIVDRELSWNSTWPKPLDTRRRIGGPVVVEKPTRVQLPGAATALVLSPNAAKLKKLLPVWEDVVTAAGLRPEHDVEEEPPTIAPGLLGARLSDLADVRTDDDSSEANGSSIAFVFEFDGRRVLFAADAHSDLLVEMLGQLDEQPFRLEACKLPHHGSKGNVTRDLVSALDCPCWLVSSNGVRFDHPDDIALARVVRYGTRSGRHPTIAWNYNSDRLKAFTKRFAPVSSGYDLGRPTDDGLVLDL